MSPGRVSPIPHQQYYRRGMTAPKLIGSKRVVVISMVVATIVSTSAAIGGGYALHRITGMQIPLADLIVLPFVCGLMLYTTDRLFHRPYRLYARQTRNFHARVRAIVDEGDAALEAKNTAAARMARARLVAVLVEWRASQPANAPAVIRKDVEDMLARAWPDTSDIPATDPADIFLQLDSYDERSAAEDEAAVDQVKAAMSKLREAKQRLSDTVHDYSVSRRGGFDDPDKKQAMQAATRDFTQRMTEAQFAAITAADSVQARNPQLAASLADVYVGLSDALREDRDDDQPA